MIKVLIADDHAVVRRGVVQILADAPDIIVMKEVGSGQEVLKAVRESAYDVIVLDIAMPEGNGLEVLAQLQNFQPHPQVLVLSMYPEKQYAIRAFRSGAGGYLTKDSIPEELIIAIRTVARHRKYVTQSLAEKMASELMDEFQAPHAVLSDREHQVLVLLAGGKTASDIAKELSLSVKTISTYRSRILAKLQMKNTAEIIRYAFQHGLVE